MERKNNLIFVISIAMVVWVAGVLVFLVSQDSRESQPYGFPVPGGFESRVRVGKTVDQIVPADTRWHKIYYQNVSIDGLGEWNLARSRFVAQVEGDYFAYLNFGYHATGESGYPFWGGIYLNKGSEGDAIIAQNHGHQVGDGCPFGKCAALVHLEAGDYLEAWTANTCPEGKLMEGQDEVKAFQVNSFIIFRIY